MQVGADRPDGPIEQLGDVDESQILVEPQHHDRPLPRWEPHDSVPRLIDVGDASGHHRFERSSAEAPALGVFDPVHDNATQERLLGVDRLALTERHERGVDGILGQLAR